MHPAMQPLHTLYGAHQLAVVRAVGPRLPRLLLGPAATLAVDNLETFQILRAADMQTRVTQHRYLYPNSQFGQSMRRLAQLIKMDLDLEIGFADSGGWDTHVNQGTSQGQLARVISDFSQTLAAFHTDLGDRMGDVLILTMSEFGRTVSENRTSGTDHGHGTAMLVLGGNTNGGRVLGT